MLHTFCVSTINSRRYNLSEAEALLHTLLHTHSVRYRRRDRYVWHRRGYDLTCAILDNWFQLAFSRPVFIAFCKTVFRWEADFAAILLTETLYNAMRTC